MNTLLNGLKNAANYGYTENGGVKRLTTRSDLLDMFALGGAMRNRSEADCILMFRKAFAENPLYALKCLFYLRDARGGQGERRFFRVCLKDLAISNPNTVIKNFDSIPMLGRWDDFYCLVNTPVAGKAFEYLKKQIALDVESKTPSLCAKWLKSTNCSSVESRKLGNYTRKAFGMTQKQYRKTLSLLRSRINIVEKLMSEKRWQEIEFDKIPSRAGFIYRNAFAKHDIEREKAGKQSYAEFAKSSDTKVNARVLYPYECVAEAVKLSRGWNIDETQRAIVNKYWDNLHDFFDGSSFNALAVVDTSGSMTSRAATAPINVAISLGMYCAEKAGGPFAGHYISFASRPQLIKVEGIDFVDKVDRIYRTNLVDNTNIEKTFDLILETAIKNNCSQEDIAENVLIISDMEFDSCAVMGEPKSNRTYWWDYDGCTRISTSSVDTVMETIAKKWDAAGYKLPHLIFWNCAARTQNIPMIGNGPISYISGFSPSIFASIMSGKTGMDLCLETLDSERYKDIVL